MKTPPKKQANGKRTVGVVLWMVFLVLIGFVNSGFLQDIRFPRFDGFSGSGEFSLFDRLPLSVATVGILLGGVVILVLLAVFISVVRKKNLAADQEDCHDRLHPEHVVACPDRAAHWKRQLDGFLAAGLIDKEEYRVLMEKYTRETQ